MTDVRQGVSAPAHMALDYLETLRRIGAPEAGLRTVDDLLRIAEGRVRAIRRARATGKCAGGPEELLIGAACLIRAVELMK